MACLCCRSLNGARQKDIYSASDSESNELLPAGSQGVGGRECPPGAPMAGSMTGAPDTSPVSDMVPSTTRPASKQRTQTQSKVTRRRVVARFDGRPRRPVHQFDNHGCVNAACFTCPDDISTHQQTSATHTAESVADVKQLTTLHTDGDHTHTLSYQCCKFFPPIFRLISFTQYVL